MPSQPLYWSNDVNTLYNTTTNFCTPYGSPFYQTLALLRDLTKKNGYAWASNRWLAARLDCTERTITNHIARLKTAGYISTERANNKRHVQILKMPPDHATPSDNVTLLKPTNVYISSTRIPPASIRDLDSKEQYRNDAGKADNPLVSALTAHGIRRKTAERLAETEPEQCRKQLADVESGKVNLSGIRDRAAWIIAAILAGYKHKKAKRAEPTATYAAETFTKRPKHSPEPDPMEAAWKALPEAERRAIEITVKANLSTVLQRSQHIIRANCLTYLRNRNVTIRYDETTDAAYSSATSATSQAQEIQRNQSQKRGQEPPEPPRQTGQPPPPD